MGNRWIFRDLAKLTSPSEPTSCLSPSWALKVFHGFKAVALRIFRLGCQFFRKAQLEEMRVFSKFYTFSVLFWFFRDFNCIDWVVLELTLLRMHA